MNGADVNDVIACANCLHQLTVTHEWLDGLALRAGARRVLRLDGTMLARLTCGKCGEKKFSVNQATLPVSVVPARIISFTCTVCGGDGGAGGRCWKCGGTGFGNDENSVVDRSANQLIGAPTDTPTATILNAAQEVDLNMQVFEWTAELRRLADLISSAKGREHALVMIAGTDEDCSATASELILADALRINLYGWPKGFEVILLNPSK